MSRIGNLPVTLPTGVEVTLAPGQISVKGPLGMLSQRLGAGVEVKRDGDKVVFKPLDDSVQSNALSGTLRALVANMVQGVTRASRGSCSWSASAIGRRRRATSST